MIAESFAVLELSGSGNFKSFGCSPIRFNLRHCIKSPYNLGALQSMIATPPVVPVSNISSNIRWREHPQKCTLTPPERVRHDSQ
jgi:hypothetical protein